MSTTDCRNCSDSDPGAWHALDAHCQKLADQIEFVAQELYGMDGAKHRLIDADPQVQANYREEARRHVDREYAVRLDGTTMPAPRVLPNQHCWCGGEIGARSPGDHLGLGCLENITHNWSGSDD